MRVVERPNLVSIGPVHPALQAHSVPAAVLEVPFDVGGICWTSFFSFLCIELNLLILILYSAGDGYG